MAKIPQEHGRFPYSPIVDRRPLHWPNGARVAVWIIPNIEHFLFDRPSTRNTDGGVGRVSNGLPGTPRVNGKNSMLGMIQTATRAPPGHLRICRRLIGT